MLARNAYSRDFVNAHKVSVDALVQGFRDLVKYLQ